MNAATRWLCWALGLLGAVCLIDIVACTIGVGLANARPAREAGSLVMMLLGTYLLLGLASTALFWRRGRVQDAGIRTVGTIAFLIAQGLLFAFMSLATLLGTHR
jgi:hypothetical protein